MPMETAEIRDASISQKYYQAGLEAEAASDWMGAIEQFEAAYAADPDNVEVCFRLAYNLDLMGEEYEAIHLYEECCHRDRPRLNALINLAVLYEDSGKYAHAERCIRQVLNTDPNHPRARLFIRDIMASRGMVIDDEAEKRAEIHHALLDTPVTDFELTVRTRNALRKMSIRTLGDLLKVTEAELRSFKNFGDASLDEIRAMLAQKGLKLGEAIEAQRDDVKAAIHDEMKKQAGENGDELLAQPVGELELSVRARKALSLLNITTIGDLILKTEAELMGVKNFGVTSLTEIQEALSQKGLSLRKLED